MMARVTRIAVGLSLCAAGSAVRANIEVTGAEVLELDQLSPDTTIGRSVPTGKLTLEDLRSLNLLVWARNVTDVLTSTVNSLSSDPSGQLETVVATVQALIDPDLTVHACALDDSGSCDIEIGKTEDNNRYLDIILHYQADAGVGGMRVIAAEDGAKALHIEYPLSFNVLFSALRLDGSAQSREFLGRNLAQVDAGRSLDAEGLDWLGSGLIDTIVETTEAWTWKCSPRLSSSKVDFQTAIKNAIVAFEDDAADDWAVSFDDSIAAGEQAGVSFVVQYALCGHLMQIPVAIQSTRLAVSAPLVFA